MQKVTHYGCWANARRKWAEVIPDGAAVKTSKAADRFQHCTKLFSLKKYIYADVKARKVYPQNEVWPLREEYFAWLKTIYPEKGSKPENAIRPFVVDRKNCLFCDNVKSEVSSAIVYSLVETTVLSNMRI